MKLKIQEFIDSHISDWKNILSEKPYCLNITEDNVFGHDVVMLKYNQIESDFNIEIVRECRGIILDANDFHVISYAFDKFGNINESYIPKLDAKSMKSTVKIDGSIIKIVKLGNDLLISTNGTISAFNAPVAEQLGCKYKSFGDIVSDILVKKFGSLDSFKEKLKDNHTYIFELVSPWTRVVTPYPENDLYLIGCRDNISYKEIFFKDVDLAEFFKTPDILDFSTIDDCLKYASSLDWTNEGFVVMDKDFNRVKVKNPTWLAIHHLCQNHVMSYSRAIDIVKANEIDEVIGYFPEFKDALLDVKDKYEKLINSLETSWEGFMTLVTTAAPRKEAAIWIQKNFEIPGVGFNLLDNKISSVKEWLEKCPSKNLVKYLGFKE